MTEMSSRSYRPPPGHGEAPRSASSVNRSATYEGESDLFAPAAHATQRASVRPPPPSAPPPSMPAPSLGPGGRGVDGAQAGSFSSGARDENSVLFSVKDIISAAALRQSSAPAGSSGVHDPFGHDPNGMVDLHAIAQNTHSSLEVKPLDIAHLRPSVVPIAAQHVGSMWPSQQQTPTRWDQFIGLAKGPRAPLFFAGVAVVALLFVGFGAMLTAWSLSDSGAELSASIAAPLPDVASSELIEREVVQRTKVVEAPEAASTTSAARRSSGKVSYAKSAKGASSKSGSAKSTAPKKKASDPCNCHGVLACAMRCTK